MSVYQSIGKKKYKELLSLVNLQLNDETNLSEMEISERIYDAYYHEEITPTQYDYLTNLLECG